MVQNGDKALIGTLKCVEVGQLVTSCVSLERNRMPL